MHNKSPIKLSLKQRGLTLVELMIALALGLIISSAVIQTYLSNKQTYKIAQGINRLQENARFAVYFVSKDILNAGNTDCLTAISNKLNGNANEFYPFQRAISGWDYNNTSIGDNFTLNNQSELGASLNTTIPKFLSSKVIAGSDILHIKSYQRLGVELTEVNIKANSTLQTAHPHTIDNQSILLAGDCWRAELFQHFDNGNNTQLNAIQQNGNPGNRNTDPITAWKSQHRKQSTVFVYQHTYYYLAHGTSGLPSLFRLRSNLPNSLINKKNLSSAEELVEGVETFQVLYGEDLNTDNTPNRYVSANQVNNWSNVISVRIGLLFRSINNISDTDQASSYVLLDNITFQHNADDKILRYAVNTTIKLRNQGIQSSLQNHQLCNANNDTC